MYQMRIPYELLTALANSLVNDTIFEIVKRLMEIQHVTENHLLQLRNQVENEHESKLFFYYFHFFLKLLNFLKTSIKLKIDKTVVV